MDLRWNSSVIAVINLVALFFNFPLSCLMFSIFPFFTSPSYYWLVLVSMAIRQFLINSGILTTVDCFFTIFAIFNIFLLAFYSFLSFQLLLSIFQWIRTLITLLTLCTLLYFIFIFFLHLNTTFWHSIRHFASYEIFFDLKILEALTAYLFLWGLVDKSVGNSLAFLERWLTSMGWLSSKYPENWDNIFWKRSSSLDFLIISLKRLDFCVPFFTIAIFLVWILS